MRRPHWRRTPKPPGLRHAPEPPPPEPPPPQVKQPRATEDWARLLRRVGITAGIPLALLAGAHSYAGVYEYVRTRIHPPELAYSTPLLWDLLILVSSCFYLAGAMVGRRIPGWRVATHLAVAATIYTNVIAAPSPGEIWIHIMGPLIWSGIIELAAVELVGEWKATHNAEFGRVPRRLWLAGPRSFTRSWRATLRMHRTGHYDYRDAFKDLDLVDAAIRLARRADVPDGDFKVLHGWLRSGALDPRHLLPVLENPGTEGVLTAASKRIIRQEEVAAEEAERAERERRERALSDRRRAARERAELAELERPERSESVPEVHARSAPPSPPQNAPATTGDRSVGGSGDWLKAELDLLRKLYDAFITAQITKGETPSKPAVPDLLAAAETGITLPGTDGTEVIIPGEPELRLHERKPVSARKHVGPWWQTDPRNPEAADSNVRPISAAR